jgi:hypothetical protein
VFLPHNKPMKLAVGVKRQSQVNSNRNELQTVSAYCCEVLILILSIR